MKKLYLITGFLGAGKTTFVNQTMGMFPNQKIAVIVNEFGKQGIDGGLIAQKGYEVSEISNGSIFCVCRMDMFIDALSEAIKTDLDVLLVESSGLSNPSNIGEVLEKTRQLTGEGFDYRGCICLIDGKNFRRVANTAVVIPDQVREASLLVINKIDLVSPDQLMEVEKEVRNWNPDAPIVYTTYSKISQEDLEQLSPLSQEKKQKGFSKVDISSAQLTVTFDEALTMSQLEELIELLKPLVYRCKGYLSGENGVMFIDGVMDQITAVLTSGEEASHSLGLVCLYLSSQPVRRTIKEFCERYELGYSVL
ncbi:MAG: CobW family GTP-binding protein [Massiliimalia sp.]|jgi:G3E family GTPase